MFKNKRGVMLLVRLIPLLVLSIVALLLFFQVKTLVASPYAATSLFIAKDTALLIDTAESIPSNIHYEYPTSLQGNVLRRKENTIAIYNSLDDKTKISFKTHNFNPSKMYKLNVSPELDLTFFAINKQENTINLVDGFEAKLSLKFNSSTPLVKSNFEKQNLKLYLYSIKVSENAQSLKFIKNSLMANLEQEQFNFTTNKDNSSLVIILDDSNTNKTIIKYSREKNLETKSLAQNIFNVLKEFPSINLNKGMVENININKPTIEITLGKNIEQKIKDSDSDKRLLAQYIAVAIEQYYK